MPIYDNRNQNNRKNWTPAQVKIDWIESCLVNDENSSDEELLTYFMDEGNLDKEQTIMIMRQRNEAFVKGCEFQLDIEGLDF